MIFTKEEIKNKIFCGHVINVLQSFPDESVDLMATSPPYWGQRNYGTDHQLWGGDPKCEHIFQPYDLIKRGGPRLKETAGARFESNGNVCIKCGGYFGELGAEPTPDLFVTNLVSVFDEVKRVLKSSGSIYVNLSDTYSGSLNGYGIKNQKDTHIDKSPLEVDYRQNIDSPPPQANCGIPRKSLCGVPERFMISMIDKGWILRNKIIWHRKNSKPESALDRFTRSYENIYFFTKSQKYYFKQIFEPLAESTIKRCEGKFLSDKNEKYGMNNNAIKKYAEKVKSGEVVGKNKRDIWTINVTHGYSDGESHYATFGLELPETCIQASCPENGVVLDIFSGSGSTLVAARDAGKNYVGIDLSEKYCKMMARRLDLNQKKLEEF